MMKRSADGTAVRRQTPVSCVLCRTKKLRCDRTQPCSNCKARNVVCSFTDAAHVSSGSSSPSRESPLNLQTLDARLKRVEELLGARSLPIPSSLPDRLPKDIDDSKVVKYSKNEEDELSRTASQLESDAMENRPIYLSANRDVPLDPIAKRLQAASLPFPSATTALDLESLVNILPSKDQAIALFEFYIANVNWLYHIIHVPTVRKQLVDVYAALNRYQMPPYDQLALVTTIITLAAYFSPGPLGGIDHDDLHSACFTKWASLSQDSLAAANHVLNPTIESLQALILLSHNLLPNLGATAMFSAIRAITVTMAQSMALHRIDSSENKKKRKSDKYDLVTLEVKRRLWWHIASSDWLLTYMSGSQAGTYLVHPQQMETDLPNNADDETLSSVQPTTVPTEMTYFILRAKMSGIFRELVDIAANMRTNVEQIPYSIVLEFDQKLHEILNSVPACFKLDENSKAKSKAIFAVRPYLASQRDMGQVGLHTRLCRLHRPWLARGTHDPQYAYSRMICLRSARTVIAMTSDIRDDYSGFDPQRVWTITHHIFVATIILVMDFCFTLDEPRKKEKREEIMECFRLLEKCEKESTIAKTGLEQLREILRKWKNGSYQDQSDQRKGKSSSDRTEESKELVGVLWEREELQMNRIRKSPEPKSIESSREEPNPVQIPQGDLPDSWNFDEMFDPNNWMDSFNFNMDLSGDDWDVLLRQVESYDAFS